MTIDCDIGLDLEKIEKLGRIREEENFGFGRFLKYRDSDKIDKIVHRLNQEISDRIDYAICGNCCRKLKPCITPHDINRLSKRLNISAETIKDNYV